MCCDEHHYVVLLGCYIKLDVVCLVLQVNTEIVAIQRLVTSAAEVQLKSLIQQHAEKTGSAKAKAILADWSAAKNRFWQLVPPAEKNTAEANPAIEAESPVTAKAMPVSVAATA